MASGATMRLSVRGLAKAYAAPVLRDIDFDAAPGEICGLIGENGAGKSTFFNILAGFVARDAGDVRLDGTPYSPAGIKEAFRHGVSIQTQELSLIDTLSVAENLHLGALPARRGWIDRAALARSAAAIIEQLGLTGIRPDTPVASLPLAERQMLEFGKAIARPTSLLLLDEPTAALSAQQADRLHELMRERARAGVTILYASHRLEDVRSVCDRVAVMRDGEIVTTAPAQALSASEMIEAMSGRGAVAALRSGATVRQAGAVLLEAQGIRTRALPHPIDLQLRAGEIIGLAGLAGAGRTEVIEALFGLAPLLSGTVTVTGDGAPQPVTSAARATALGMGLVTEDRKQSGIFAGQDIAFNAAIAGRGRWTIDRAVEGAAVGRIVDLLRIRCSGIGQDIASLSGGNQQKVLFGRWLLTGATILLLDEPGRGVDVAAKHDLYAEAAHIADAGGTVLVASSELEELTALCDRVLVLSARRLVAEFTGPDWDEKAILVAAFQGHVAAGAP